MPPRAIGLKSQTSRHVVVARKMSNQFLKLQTRLIDQGDKHHHCHSLNIISITVFNHELPTTYYLLSTTYYLHLLLTYYLLPTTYCFLLTTHTYTTTCYNLQLLATTYYCLLLL